MTQLSTRRAMTTLAASLAATATALLALSPIEPAVASGSTSSESTNLVANGNFAWPAWEKSNPGATYVVFNGPKSSPRQLAGWSPVDNFAFLFSNDMFNPPPGVAAGKSAAMMLYSPGNGTPNTGPGIRQAVRTTPGLKYYFSWVYAPVTWNMGQCAKKTKTGSVNGGGTGTALFDGKVVATFSAPFPSNPPQQNPGPNLTPSNPEWRTTWRTDRVEVTATSATSTVGFNTVYCGPLLDEVSLVAAPVVIHGFTLPLAGTAVTLSSPYGTAERQTVEKLPAKAALTHNGATVVNLKAATVVQRPRGSGLTITWVATPAPGYLKASSAIQRAGAASVLEWLTLELRHSDAAYKAHLKADLAARRLPPSGGTAPLEGTWTVRLAAVSTTGKEMFFNITERSSSAALEYAQAGVPTFTGPLGAARAPLALRDFLYYTK